jgi:hypothetical protein
MADFKLYGGTPPATTSAGVMTQGLGFPLREVELEASPAASEVHVTFGRNGNVLQDRFLEFGSVVAAPWLPHKPGTIIFVTISQDANTASEIGILVNGVVVETVPINSMITLHEMSVPVEQLDTVQVKNKASGAAIRDVVVSLIIRSTP